MATETAPSSLERPLPSPTSLEVQWVQHASELEPLVEDWNRLAGSVPFLSFEWLVTWWRYYSQRRQRLLVLVVRDADGVVVGIAPWYIRRSTVQGRVIDLLGSGEVCTEYVRIMTDPHRREDVAHALAGFLLSRHAPRWDLIEWLNVESGPTCHNRVVQLLGERGCAVEQQPGMNCWRLRLSDDWDRFVTHLSRKKREIIRQIHRKTFDAGRLTIHNILDPADLPKGLDILIDLHQRRRNQLNEHGCFSSRRFLAYHHAVAPQMLARGNLFLCWIELDGQPAVVWYGLRTSETLYLYQTGFDPDLSKASPGQIGVMAAIKLAMQRGITEIDFLRGDEPYKATWGAEPQATLDVRVAAPGGRAWLRHWLWKNGRRAKALVKQSLSWAGLMATLPE